jgi:hypothetical protein
LDNDRRNKRTDSAEMLFTRGAVVHALIDQKGSEDIRENFRVISPDRISDYIK